MRLAVVLEQRFCVTPDGRSWTEDAFAYDFWTRYLAAFDDVLVVARAQPLSEPLPGSKRVDGPNVTVAPLPCYVGPAQFVRRLPVTVLQLRQALADADAVLLRTPGALSNLAFRLDHRKGRPFGVEVVGDPSAVFAKGVVEHPLRPLLQAWFTRSLSRQCQAAAVACYVTKHTLQRRYPPGPGAHVSWYSNVDLPDDAFAGRPAAQRPTEPFRLMTVGSMDQLYKGIDLVLEAVAACRARGLDIRLVVVGDGRHRPELEAHARALGLTGAPHDAVLFAGRLPGSVAVRQTLREADLFVLASRTEGLPRALIEAMAQGLPCVATAVGGIPELLEPEDLVPAGDAKALADRLVEILGDAERRSEMAARNLAVARGYRRAELAARWTAAYHALAAAAGRTAATRGA